MDPKTILIKLKKKLSTKIKINKIYIFGSRAKGTFYPESDYDIAIISSDFKKMPFLERQILTRALIRKVLGKTPIDVACYTPEEFKKGKQGFLPEIIEKEGISI